MEQTLYLAPLLRLVGVAEVLVQQTIMEPLEGLEVAVVLLGIALLELVGLATLLLQVHLKAIMEQMGVAAAHLQEVAVAVLLQREAGGPVVMELHQLFLVRQLHMLAAAAVAATQSAVVAAPAVVATARHLALGLMALQIQAVAVAADTIIQAALAAPAV
jgi:hypothetical protein